MFCVVFDWNKTAVFEKYFYLARVPLPCPLFREDRILSGSFIVCVHWHFWNATLFRSSLGYRRPNENPGNALPYCPSPPKVPSYSAFFSSPFRVFLYLFHI